ncbi:dihydrodipicolinate synthase family protein [Chloroflexi bacterium TSY]|nr:dihydrodipicolinate synthase family protein [Chloroflexi bacterium TSY]
MLFDTATLLDALYSVTTIPIVPYMNGQIDFVGHRKNVEYLMTNNHLDQGRPRVLSIAGTSLIHHIESDDQNSLFEQTGRVMGNDGVLMSAIVPNPIGTAGRLIEIQSQFQRPPDVYLIMPLGGIYSPAGLYETFMQFGETYGNSCGARFLYYFRQPRDLPQVIQLLNDSPHFIGVKVGTGVEHVRPLIEGVGDNAMVIWGIGDRSTDAAELGAKGHTSGTAVVAARTADEINNAQRRGDFAAARKYEAILNALEEIRFRDGRKYNYAAVVEALNVSGFEDIVGGDGGPFNPHVPKEVSEEVKAAVDALREYH